MPAATIGKKGSNPWGGLGLGSADGIADCEDIGMSIQRMTSMKKLLSAAIGTALLLASTGGALAQLGYSGDGLDRRVAINNYSGYVITYVFAVPSRWGVRVVNSPDFIVGAVIGPGQYYNVNFDRGDRECILDIRAIDGRGGEWVRRGFNVCAETQWSLRN
jgi:hypothetical protein